MITDKIDNHCQDPVKTLTNWTGTLTIDYGRVNGQTQVLNAYAQAPLKLQRSFYPEDPTVCHSVVLHTAGGVVGGDRLHTQLTLAPHSHALVTTAAAQKLYRSSGAVAHQSLQIEVQPQAILEWLPQDTIVFAGANYSQTQRIQLADGAIWVGMEILRFGRTARGERFDAGLWRSHTEVWQGQRPLWIERTRLVGEAQGIASPTTLAGCAVIGTFVVVGYGVDADGITALRNCYAPPSPPAQIGVSRLLCGVISRYRGNSTAQARDYFLTLWDQLRRGYAGRGACLPRVWQWSGV